MDLSIIMQYQEMTGCSWDEAVYKLTHRPLGPQRRHIRAVGRIGPWWVTLRFPDRKCMVPRPDWNAGTRIA